MTGRKATGNRLDMVLLARGLVATRSKARDAIARGQVQVDGRAARKAGARIREHAVVEIAPGAATHVSRGGIKLAHALDHFAIDVNGMTALDLGASTGGFTEVLLRRGAARVHALDVGHGQLHPSLARDPRVVALERLNARDLTRDHLGGDAPDLIVADLSFISLKLALPAALALAAGNARLVALVKPQFEVGRAHVGKGGIVRDEAVRDAACEDISRWLEHDRGWPVAGITPSPVKGAGGNGEYLIHARR